MTLHPEVAAILHSMRNRFDANCTGYDILNGYADRLESSLTKAEPVAPICCDGDCTGLCDGDPLLMSAAEKYRNAKRTESAIVDSSGENTLQCTAVAWTIWDAKDVRFTVYNRDLAEAIAEKGLLVLPMFGDYEWFDAQGNKWIPISRLPHTWERELRLGWRQRSTDAPPPASVPDGLLDRIKSAEQRIQAGHAPQRIPADPTDVDLVLAEVRMFLETGERPFWIKPTNQEGAAP